jgi:hypothetical protein
MLWHTSSKNSGLSFTVINVWRNRAHCIHTYMKIYIIHNDPLNNTLTHAEKLYILYQYLEYHYCHNKTLSIGRTVVPQRKKISRHTHTHTYTKATSENPNGHVPDKKNHTHIMHPQTTHKIKYYVSL